MTAALNRASRSETRTRVIVPRKVCIFVDGENFRKSVIQHLRPKEDYLPTSNGWGAFFMCMRLDAFSDTPYRDDDELVRVYWHVPASPHFKPNNLPPDGASVGEVFSALSSHKVVASSIVGKTPDDAKQRVAELHKEYLNNKQKFLAEFHRRHEIQDQIQEVAFQVEFRRAGTAAYDVIRNKRLGEKGVDVALAVDMLRFADIYDVAIVVTGDQDLVPAVQAIKDIGKQVYVPIFVEDRNKEIAGLSASLRCAADRLFRVHRSRIESLYGD